ncbi:MAG: tripartite tricarboxylate transporter TctB family protein [Pseudomonadota bacterium]
MTLDKGIAVVFLVIALIYGYAALTYPLLPFERNLAFLPNTLPTGLSVLAIILSSIIILSPRPKADADGEPLGGISMERLREFKIGQALGLIAAMIAYALLLRPAGFIPATTVFLVGTGWILGERKLYIMVPIALFGAAAIWFLVQETLGIFLRPLPEFLG